MSASLSRAPNAEDSEERKGMSANHRDEAYAPGAAGDSGERLSISTCSVDMRFLTKDVDRAVRLMLSVQGEILAKRGCRACDVAVAVADPAVVHYREEWDSEETFHEHVRSEEFRRVLIAMDMSCEEPRIVIGNLTGHSGLAFLRNIREPDPCRVVPRGELKR
jgi:quinol monooxygenase YgiN